MSPFCAKCGSIIPSGSAFCTNCGAESAQPDADPVPLDPNIRQPHIWMQDEPEAAPAAFRQSDQPAPQSRTTTSPEQQPVNNQYVNAGIPLRARINPTGFMPPYKKWNPGLAAFFSLLIPGLGQFYKDRAGIALIWFFAVLIGYVFIGWPTVFLHILCVAAAASAILIAVEIVSDTVVL